ncbi:S8 family serine peptidase [Octadecabacter sp.]|nr:S8 family serine peptidase [Octadecabacter sp.]
MTIQATNSFGVLVGLALTTSLLSGCGGGGGGDAYQYDYTQGTPSSEASADSAINNSPEMALPYEDEQTGTTYNSLSNAHVVLNGGGDFVATADTGARSAWQSGWTGENVRVGIADDFNSNGRTDTHGDRVTLITNSVAPEADYALIDMLGPTQDMTADEALDYFESNGYHIINASWGISRFDQTSGVEYLNFDAHVESLVQGFDQNAENAKQALIIYAAGNSGNTCTGRRSEDCSLQQAYIATLRDAGYTAGENAIFVGSLEDGSDEMASYSIIAGDLMYDFIVAHDDVLYTGDGSGTSYAAPRVTGAAALVSHKFPNLTSAQVKQVLLQTADDLGATGVDEVFGYGRLSVVNSLSPVGTVVPR